MRAVRLSGLNTPGAGNIGAGPIPSGVTVTWSDASDEDVPRRRLDRGDCPNRGQQCRWDRDPRVQCALAQHDARLVNCNAEAASCDDMPFGEALQDRGDCPDLSMALDASIVSNITTTAAATIGGKATTVTTTITPQSAVVVPTRLAVQATPTCAPAAPLNMLQQAANAFTDATRRSTPRLVCAGTKLAGLADIRHLAEFDHADEQVHAHATDSRSGQRHVHRKSPGVYSWVAPTATGPPCCAQATGNQPQVHRFRRCLRSDWSSIWRVITCSSSTAP